ncbi:protocatechuate 3,4-dioxygenase beta subunit [Actinoplanes lutulentus]|uniref:Protocatechuate 3,4-dioxygenase beta subunit n=1 Tax=Actinoplanes lutulentus TaxID=1287878 RepID=A0A327ZNH9_9ACTN|nr:hypothetical protein [Actinoplanes lutulentus]MBB2943973.1 protocatechuate 3,4-dioxygenase beta subunit [Actinoplanes lutulentus]RAK42794.1 hypothetical protein B0I29_102620 [Actinoplanes lutulentus]
MRSDENGGTPVISRGENPAALPGARRAGEPPVLLTPAPAQAPVIPGSSGTALPQRSVPGTAWMAGPATRAVNPKTALLLTPDLEGRAHHLPLELVRRDIAGDHPGVPLMLRIRVLGDESGDPVVGAVLDIRHCDALGRTQVRGAQMTDHQGYAEFRTVHPGWLPDEPVHIAAEVHVGGYLAGGRSIAHSGRLYLPESLAAQVAQMPPYRNIRTTRAVDDEHASTLHVVPRDRFHLASGLLASIVIAVQN